MEDNATANKPRDFSIMRILILIAVLGAVMLLIACSCKRERRGTEGEQVSVQLRISLDCYSGFSTKSAYAGDAVSDINVWLLDPCGTSAFHSYGSFGPFAVKLWSGLKYDLYIVANAGGDLGDADGTMLRSMRFETSVRGKAACIFGGVPMSGKRLGMSPSELSAAQVALDRVCSKVKVRLDKSGLVNATVAIDSVALCDIPSSVRLYGESKAESSVQILPKGDVISGTGLNALTSTGIELYCFENAQGILLECNTDERAKVLGTGDAHYGRCTYLEFWGYYSNVVTAMQGPIRYRLYLGGDETSDFNLLRDKLYDVHVSISGNGYAETTWRVDVSDIRSMIPEKGNYFYSDSTYSGKYDRTKTCVGILFDVDTTRPAGNQYWIAALQSTTNACWSTRSEAIAGLRYNASPSINPENWVNDRDGAYNTRMIVQSANYSQANYPAAYYCANYSTAGFGAGRWSFPAFPQVFSLFDIYNQTAVWTAMTTAGGKSLSTDYSLYNWSSTPSTSGMARYVNTYNSQGYLMKSYSNNTCVRAILQF